MVDNLVVPAVATPYPRAQVKSWLKVTVNAEDSDVDRLLRAAVEHVETFTGRSLVREQRRLLMDHFPPCIELPRSPLRAVLSVQYLDDAGDLQTLPADEYRVDKESDTPKIDPEYGIAWPTTYPVRNAVRVNYIAGFLQPFVADAGTDVLTAADHGLEAGDVSLARALGPAGVLATGLAELRNYYVINPTANTLQLALTPGGAAVDVTVAGTEPMALGAVPANIEMALALICAHLWVHREENSDFQLHEVPLGASRLLWPSAVSDRF